jgi:hypothetical protein
VLARRALGWAAGARAARRGIAFASMTDGRHAMRRWHWFTFVFVFVGAVAVTGCASRESAGGSVELTSAPVGYGSYPQAYYDGRTVYWVNNEWAYQDGGVWFSYGAEPLELRSWREGGFRGGFEGHGGGRGGHEGHGGGEHGGGEHGGGGHGGGGHGGGGHR